MHRTSASVFVAAVALLVLGERDARAIERQHHLALSPTLAMLKVADKSTLSVGAGLSVDYTYGLSDQFNFVASVGENRVASNQRQDEPTSPRTRPADVQHATAGVAYVIDVLRFVPYAGAQLGAYRLSGGTLDSAVVAPGASLTLGLDYQLDRHWAVGIAGAQHLLLAKTSTYPSYTTLMLRVEVMWGY
jgi:hypothetical protein